MSANLDRLSHEALELSAEEKMQLVEAILESLDSGELSPERKKRLEELWDEGIASGRAECERRLDAYLSGDTSARDAEDVLAKYLKPRQ